MDFELKQKWLDALRSGEYQQGQNYLCNDSKYCCLGVLAEINGDLAPSEKESIKIVDRKYSGVPLEATFPSELMKKYGLKDTHCQQLMSLNDYDRFTFEQIADYIEETL